ncbi:MAG: sugar phosphate isomerase/epimerase, partial [Armatimonadetes bacterium]|nr:sugar phosphate isomerase/epimerase [Anaerolineae bacterium]
LVIENIFDHHPLMLTALVRSFESEYVRQSLDTGHAYINYTQGAPAVDYWVKTAGELLGHVHLQDTDGYSDRHWTIGDGKIDWRCLFAALAELPQQPRLVLELADNTDIPRAMRWFSERGLAR